MALIYHRVSVAAGVTALLLAAAGCQFSGRGGDAAGADKLKSGQVLESQLRAYCPQVELREGTAFFTQYAKGGDGDPTKLLLQAAITDVTRTCSRGNGQLTMTVAAAGKVVIGPAGKPGPVTMPIRIVVLRGKDVLFSRLYKQQVQAGQDATQWVFSDRSVVVPEPTAADIQVFAGFDEGPPPKAAGPGAEG